MNLVVDIDGTLSDHTGRYHHVSGPKKDWASYYGAMGDDPPVAGAQKALNSMVRRRGTRLTLLTGRPETYRDVTVAWLRKHYDLPPVAPGIAYQDHVTSLIMRRDGDHRRAVVFKEEAVKLIYATSTRHLLFIDDDVRNGDMYAQYGTYLVAPVCWNTFY